MPSKYVRKELEFNVKVTFDAAELSDREGADIFDAAICDIEVDGFHFANWKEATAHMDAAKDKQGDWEYDN